MVPPATSVTTVSSLDRQLLVDRWARGQRPIRQEHPAMRSHHPEAKVALLDFSSKSAVLLENRMKDQGPARHTVDRLSVG